MKKLLMLSIALLVAAPGLEARHGKCAEKIGAYSKQKCKACRLQKKECACRKKHVSQCKSCSKNKGLVGETADVIEAPFVALFGGSSYTHKSKGKSSKKRHNKRSRQRSLDAKRASYDYSDDDRMESSNYTNQF